MSVSSFAYGVWALVGAIALSIATLATVLGYMKVGSLVTWRSIKLASNFSGLIGIGLLLMNFETQIRRGFSGEISMDAALTFIEVKTLVLEEMAAKCSDRVQPEAERLCTDLRHIHSLQHYAYVRDSKPLPLLREDQYSTAAHPFLKRVNTAIEQINMFAKRPEDQWELISTKSRPKVLLCAAILLALAVAGSVGEAAFQLRLARDTHT